MMTSVANRPRRGVKSCEGKSWWKKEPGGEIAVAIVLPRVVADLATRKACQVLFKGSSSPLAMDSFSVPNFHRVV